MNIFQGSEISSSDQEIDGLLASFIALEMSDIDISPPYDFKGDYAMHGLSYRISTKEESEWKDVVIKIDNNKINGHGTTIFRSKPVFFILIGCVSKWIDGYPYEIKFIKYHPELNQSIKYNGIIKENSIAFHNSSSYGYLEF
jgi:hypothetical protein